MAHEELEDRELPRGQTDVEVAPATAMPRRVEYQIAGHQHRCRFTGTTTKKGTQMRDKHHKTKRLRQEIIGARIKRFGFIELPILCREHQHWRPVASVAEPFAHLEAVQLGKHDVEDNRVERALRGSPQSRLTVGSYLHRPTFGLQLLRRLTA